MFLVSEGGKGVLVYGIQLSEGKGESHARLGCFILKTNHRQKVHGKGVYRRINFVSIVNESDLEAGAVLHPVKDKLVNKVRNVRLVPINFQIGGVDLASKCDNNVLIDVKTFEIFQEKLKEVRILVWLEIIMFTGLMIIGANRVRKKVTK
jgi:hypothetical protein